MKKRLKWCMWVLQILLGSAIFALGFDLFLEPNNVNVGGISGLGMVIVEVAGFGTVGLMTTLMNLPLFALGGLKIGKKFFVGSLLGMGASSALIDVFALLPAVQIDPLMAALYGGLLCGAGLGLVFMSGGSTGGTDILVRLFKQQWRNTPIGQISMALDVFVAILTGIVFRDVTKALYCGVATFVTSRTIDAIVYRFDYSRVVIIISKKHEQIAQQIDKQLERGVTYLYGQGHYSRKDTKVILTAVKRQQLAELKELVVRCDPKAFIIVQEAHQVLGDGFIHYEKDAL